jgi:hypothetical protein
MTSMGSQSQQSTIGRERREEKVNIYFPLLLLLLLRGKLIGWNLNFESWRRRVTEAFDWSDSA